MLASGNLGVRLRRQADVGREDALDGESRIYPDDVEQAGGQQASENQKSGAKADFQTDQGFTKLACAAAFACGRGARLQRVLRIGMGKTPGGENAEDCADEGGEQESKHKHAAIDSDIIEAR